MGEFDFISLYKFLLETTEKNLSLYHIVSADDFGGAKGSRTPDLLNAIQALSQLSYGPGPGISIQ
jgi:hypothetical protein